MKTLTAMFAGLALLCGSTAAMADPGHGHGHDRGHGHDHHYDRRHDYHHDYRDHGRGYREVRYYGPPPGYRGRHWSRGDRYYGPTYVVRDYGYYRLRPPPHGYHWVRDDRNYLLVSIGSGVILDLAFR